MTKTEPYRPLPRTLYVGNSPIEGNGVFTSDNLSKNEELGISHVKNNSGDFHSNYIRTPLGGFINHSEEPNCELYECGEYLKMKTIKNINPGEELTLDYTFYKPCKNYMCDSTN